MNFTSEDKLHYTNYILFIILPGQQHGETILRHVQCIHCIIGILSMELEFKYGSHVYYTLRSPASPEIGHLLSIFE